MTGSAAACATHPLSCTRGVAATVPADDQINLEAGQNQACNHVDVIRTMMGAGCGLNGIVK